MGKRFGAWMVGAVLVAGVVVVPGAPANGATQVRARVTRSTISSGQKAYIVGAVSPAQAVRVVLERKVGSTWSARQSTTATGSGAFKITVPMSVVGLSTFRVRGPGGTFSGPLYIRVKPANPTPLGAMPEVDGFCGEPHDVGSYWTAGKRMSGYPLTSAVTLDWICRGAFVVLGLRREFQTVTGWLGALDSNRSGYTSDVTIECDGKKIGFYPGITNGSRIRVSFQVEGCSLFKMSATNENQTHFAYVALADAIAR